MHSILKTVNWQCSGFIRYTGYKNMISCCIAKIVYNRVFRFIMQCDALRQTTFMIFFIHTFVSNFIWKTYYNKSNNHIIFIIHLRLIIFITTFLSLIFFYCYSKWNVSTMDDDLLPNFVFSEITIHLWYVNVL